MTDLTKEFPNPWDVAGAKYLPGQKVKGKVVNLTAYGAFIELEPGIEGLLHITELSWCNRHVTPAKVLKLEQDNRRVALSIKRLTPDPWDPVDTYHQVGNIIRGTVSKVANYGAYVALDHGIEGLVHMSEISEGGVDRVKNVLHVGQEITARVISIDQAERRIGLSIKAAKSACPS